MPLLERDQSSTLYKGSIDRIGVLPANIKPVWWLRVAGSTETMSVTLDSLASGVHLEALVLAKPGDLVSMTVTRRFGNLVVSDFVNTSVR